MANLKFIAVNFKKRSGQTIVELLLAIGLSSIFLPALITGLVASRDGKAQQIQRLEAVTILKETNEAVRNYREKGWENFAVNGTFHPEISGSSWILASGSAAINNFTQTVVISDVYRDTDGKITTLGGTLDPSSKKVVTTISWVLPKAGSVDTTGFLTRYLDNISYNETTEAQFNMGIKNSTLVTNTAGGEVQLVNNNKAKWCSPELSSSTIDLPDGPPVAVAAVADLATTEIPNDVFVATAPYATSSVKFAYLNVSANIDPPTTTPRGIFTLDENQYSDHSYIPTGINLTNDFKTNDVKYYKSSSGKLYALMATNLPDHEVIAIQINDGTGDAFQDPVNKIYKYWTYFNTTIYAIPTAAPTPTTAPTLTPVPTIAPPQVVNGDFETGSLNPNWPTRYGTATNTINNNATYVHSGSYSAKVVITTNNDGQGLGGGGACSGGSRTAITPSVSYNWSGWIRVNSGASRFNSAYVQIRWYDACTGGSSISSHNSSTVTTANGVYTQVTGTATAPANANFAEIRLLVDMNSGSGPSATVYYDDITMSVDTPTPTPTPTITPTPTPYPVTNDQAPFGYGAKSITILDDHGYVTSGGYLYVFDLSNIDSKSTSNGLDQVGCRIQLDGYDCQPGSGTDRKYNAGQTGTTWSDTTGSAHPDCSDGGNIELYADNQIYPVQVGGNTYIYVAVGAGTNPELDIVNTTSVPDTGSSPTISSNNCGRINNGNAGWKTVGSLDFDNYSNTEEAANSVYAKSDGTRAYMSSNGGIMHNGISDSDQFYIIDTTNKSSPQFLTHWTSTQITPTPGHYANTASSGYYNGDSANIELYPRRALTVLNGQRAIIVGQDGVSNLVEPKEYQVINIDPNDPGGNKESAPTYCGGIFYLPGFNDLTSVSEADGDNFVYMVANTMEKQLKIIQGGPDSGIYASSGYFESQTYDAVITTAFNNFIANINQLASTNISAQIAVAPPVNNSCNNAVFTFVGPGGDSNAFFTPTEASISAAIPFGNFGDTYQNPGRCFRYKMFLSTNNAAFTPVFYDINVNFSP